MSKSQCLLRILVAQVVVNLRRWCHLQSSSPFSAPCISVGPGEHVLWNRARSPSFLTSFRVQLLAFSQSTDTFRYIDEPPRQNAIGEMVLSLYHEREESHYQGGIKSSSLETREIVQLFRMERAQVYLPKVNIHPDCLVRLLTGSDMHLSFLSLEWMQMTTNY